MMKVWKWYTKCLELHPIKTQVLSSGVLWGTGDVLAQTITRSSLKKQNKIHDDEEVFKINWKRVGITSMFGAGFVGPVGHYWYLHLDRFMKIGLKLPPNSKRFVGAKVALDGLIFGPLDLCVFFSYMGLASGKSWPQVKEDLKRDFLPALIVEGGVWPILQIANFRYVPLKYQLLYVNMFCLVDSAVLSWIDQQEDAPWKEWLLSYLIVKEQEGQG